MPFVVLDKREASIQVFDASGNALGATSVLLGLAAGDLSVPGIGERKLEDVRPHERTTPAGRFVAARGKNIHGEDIVWIDYDAAVSLHRLRANVAEERRHERLATTTPADNRISYGCVNVPAVFYDQVVDGLVRKGPIVVYILPEMSAREGDASRCWLPQLIEEHAGRMHCVL